MIISRYAIIVREILVIRRSFSGLTHVKDGLPKMVDISEKRDSVRVAHAQAVVYLPEKVLRELMIDDTTLDVRRSEIYGKKGPVFSTAIIAGVMGAKKTSEWIPFCHPIPIDGCDITIQFNEEKKIVIDCIVKTSGKTGVEMEALVGASNAALCIYDMLKALSHEITIEQVKLCKKSGGKTDFSAV